MMIDSIQQAVFAELDHARELPLRYREDARAAVSHALASHLVDCTLRQGAAEAVLMIGGYEVIVRPVAGAQVQAPAVVEAAVVEEAEAADAAMQLPEGFADTLTSQHHAQAQAAHG